MSTPPPPGGMPQSPGTAPTPPPGSPPGGEASPATTDKPKDKSMPWKIATIVLALTTVGFAAWGISTNNKLNDLQASTDQQMAELQAQLKQLEQQAGAKEASQAKEIAKLKQEIATDRKNLKVDKANIKKEAAELKQLNANYQKEKSQAAAEEGNLKQQLQASQAQAQLAKQCATVMAAGLNRLYVDGDLVTYKDVNKAINAAAAHCGDIVNLD